MTRRSSFTERLLANRLNPQAPNAPQSKPQPTSDTNAGYLDVSKEGICPKTGLQMTKARLVGGSRPQEVWFCEKSRVCLPVTDAKEL